MATSDSRTELYVLSKYDALQYEIVKPYNLGNYMNFRELLKDEGMTDEQITVENDILVECELGFISYKMVHGYPYISHFLLYKEHRTKMNFIKLYHVFRDEMLRNGYVNFIAEVTPGREYFGQFIRGQLGAKEPYAKDNGNEYYLIKLLQERRDEKNLH